MKNIPTIEISYRGKNHESRPHIVKFSGGRSSGMLLLSLLGNGLLDAARGDAIVFNDTSAEHPETYKFTAKCKRIAEERFGIPFFWLQFQTYEDARRGTWIRKPSFRMAKPVPWSVDEPEGYLCKGEAFEELLAWSGYVPNQFQRICTQRLKVEITIKFLKQWIRGRNGLERLGHFGEASRLEDDAMFALHKKNRGEVSKEIYLRKKEFLKGRPFVRPRQKFSDFSCSEIHPRRLYQPRGEIEYVTFLGLRADEPRRVSNMRSKYHGLEHIYLPLADMGVSKLDVNSFWKGQDFDLGLDSESGLSNCVYCFLKGSGTLRKVHQRQEADKTEKTADSPVDIRWWERIEQTYSRDVINKNQQEAVIGFFGIKKGLYYKSFARDGGGELDASKFQQTDLPCDCTD